MDPIRVRFAPSPTGYLHVGGARTALFNWLFARHNGGKFILRIEDTDRERSKPEYEEAILADLQWLGLDWDEGPSIGGPYAPYRQTERAALYREQLNKLLAGGNAYPCFCTQKDLEAERLAVQAIGKNYRYSGKCRGLTAAEAEAKKASSLPYSIRLKVPEGSTSFDDIVRGHVTVDHAELDDIILVRTGGEPTYNFVATVDDALMRITHVIRGDDHISNTPKQVLLYRALGFEPPKFAHIPLILGADRTPLSKRHGTSAVGEFKKQGYLPEAMLNYLALLGWSLDGKSEIFSKGDLVHSFGLDRVVKSPACFSYEKLQWLNGQYIREADEERIYQLCLEQLWNAKAIDEDFMRQGGPALRRMVGIVKGNLKTLSEIGDQLAYFLGEFESYDPQGMEKYLKPSNVPVLEEALALLEGSATMDAMTLEEKFRAAATAHGRKFAEYVHPLRLAVTGRTSSPNIFELVEILGSARCVARLRRFIGLIKTKELGKALEGPSGT